jgi:hypothetical protein
MRDPQFEIAASNAFYGGRFETSAIGLIPGPIQYNDIRSAFPAAMPHLPCPLHTRWEHKPHATRLPDGGIYLAKVSFVHPDVPWCGLPFRQNGGLFWPLQGTGWYWSPELEAAQRHVHTRMVNVHDLWIARCECDCRPFEWVRDLYDKRRELGSDTRGYPVKFGMNSLYGKTAQRCGHAPFHDVVSAGLTTAITRARLLEAVGQNPDSVLMLAADAVFSRKSLSLDIGMGLGQWGEESWPDLFITQPGVYWSPSKVDKSIKSRGAPRSIIGPAAPRFQEVFAEWLDLLRRPGAMDCVLKERQIPTLPVIVRVFIGCRLAVARGKPWEAGKWEDVPRHISFEWQTKREPMRISVMGEGYVITFPRAISIFDESEGYEPADFDRLIDVSWENGAKEPIDENMVLEAMPDFIPFLPHE